MIRKWKKKNDDGAETTTSREPLTLNGSAALQVERCNYFLHACVETAQRQEPVDGRLVQFLLSNPTNDGGQWDMLVNLIGQFPSPQFSLFCRISSVTAHDALYVTIITVLARI